MRYQIIKQLENYFQNISCFSWIKWIPVLSQISIKQFHIRRASLPPLRSLSNFTVANWNPSSTPSSSCFSSIFVFCNNPFYHAPTQVLDIPNRISIQVNQICYQATCRSEYLLNTWLNTPPIKELSTSTISNKNPFLYFSQFSPHYSTLVHKIILTVRTNMPFHYTSVIFHLPIFAYNHPNNLHWKHFAHLRHLSNSGCVKGPGS